MALNISNIEHVLHGLNQRNFAPYLGGTPVISDAQADIANCFDVGSEMLVFHNHEELNAIYADFLASPQKAAIIGENGKRRVLADHSIGERLAAIADALTLSH